MTKSKLALYGLLAALVVFFIGWLIGSSGRRDAESRLATTQLRLDLAEARGAIASARVDLFELNFGQSVRRLDEGRRALQGAAARVGDDGPRAMAEPLEAAISNTTQAHELAGRMDQAAGSRAAEALRALDRAAGMLPRT
jgi:hypothetical protein